VQHLGSADGFAAAAIVVAAAALGAIATRLLIPLLRRSGVLDRPNERSSHNAPTPRGGGIAVLGTVLVFWLGLAAGGWITPRLVAVALAALLLAAVSWLDDLRGLPPLLRLIAQAAAVATGLAALPAPASADAAWLGSTAALPILGIVWLWWVNLYNFMDGIDGIAGCQTAAIGGGLLTFTAIGGGTDASVALLAAPILGAALGFLLWNWAPARIFLGDVGSVPLGYLTGYLLLGLVVAGAWKIAAILPLYFFTDATLTLGRRLLRGERVWQPHRQHFYQRAVRRGLGHAAVVKRVILANLLLIACGWAAENGAGAAALPAAAVVVAVLLAALAGGGQRPTTS
jgi:UDP-N-acetylmuramyl pentapeptide phosphotransferase/UDP-N-acetylglucosamine-1-phosphate transferase